MQGLTYGRKIIIKTFFEVQMFVIPETILWYDIKQLKSF